MIGRKDSLGYSEVKRSLSSSSDFSDPVLALGRSDIDGSMRPLVPPKQKPKGLRGVPKYLYKNMSCPLYMTRFFAGRFIFFDRSHPTRFMTPAPAMATMKQKMGIQTGSFPKSSRNERMELPDIIM